MSSHNAPLKPPHATPSGVVSPSELELKRLLQAHAQAPQELPAQHSFGAVMGRAQARAERRSANTWAWLMNPPLALGAVALSALMLWSPSARSPEQSTFTRGALTQDSLSPQDELAQRELTLSPTTTKNEAEWLEPLTWGDGWLESEEWAPSWEEL